MSTIKYNIVNGQTKFVLKEGKASCSCCQLFIPEQCCMYPADGLGITYDIDDLPETVTAFGQDGAYQVSFTKAVSGIYENQEENARIAIVNGAWATQSYNATDGWTEFQDTAPNPCLIFEPFSQNLAYVGDEFANSYTASCTNIDSGQTSSKTYYRETICIWRSRNINGDVDGQLYFRSHATALEAASFGKGRIMWALEGAGFRSTDDGPYNSPEGFYGANRQCQVTSA